MSNIDRKYKYLDEGSFPEEGEYGVTYLTLYSSGAGNVYDGWIWDPDHKTTESLTERTFGYRNPDNEDYCYDDEVVVDLSNPQSREESDENERGRITSFNTNVSSTPIFIPDAGDVSSLTEEERESKATTVLFCKIPLVKDAYIHAEVEIQAKMNISADNTTGRVRVEAFYILNDESDRTMRPHPIAHTSVAKDNEYDTFRFLYWNPALKHEDNNYIGVKLLVSGGTAEIGISDNPEYGDAIITLTSAGLVGDNIDSGDPIYIELSGKEEVGPGYELDIDDYKVLAYYDTGEVYDVTRLCEFDPPMTTPIEDAVTYLTAYFKDLSDMMVIYLGQVEYIELTGNETIYGSYTLDISDYRVIAYFDNGDEWDVTSQCTFSPAMGTTVTTDTTLTATYTPFWMQGQTFTDSLELISIGVDQVFAGPYPNHGLIYTYYEDGWCKITGNAIDTTFEVPPGSHNLWPLGWPRYFSHSTTIPIGWNILKNNIAIGKMYGTVIDGNVHCVEEGFDHTWNIRLFSYTMYSCIVMPPRHITKGVEWAATGKPIGICLLNDGALSSWYLTETRKVEFKGFEKIDTSEVVTLEGCFAGINNETDLSWVNSRKFPKLVDMAFCFANSDNDLSTLNQIFISDYVDTIGRYGKGNIDLYHRPQYIQPDGSISTVNSIGITEDDEEILIPTIGIDSNGTPIQMTDEEAIDYYYDTGEYLGKFNTIEECDAYGEALHLQQEWYYSDAGKIQNISCMFHDFKGSVLPDFASKIDTSWVLYANGLCRGAEHLTDISNLAKMNISKIQSMNTMFYECDSLENFKPLSHWRVFYDLVTTEGMFFGCQNLKDTDFCKGWRHDAYYADCMFFLKGSPGQVTFDKYGSEKFRVQLDNPYPSYNCPQVGSKDSNYYNE